jgi:hypothetical protein
MNLTCATGSASAELHAEASSKGHWQSQWHTSRQAGNPARAKVAGRFMARQNDGSPVNLKSR